MVVKLDGSDAILLQRDSRVCHPPSAPRVPQLADPARLIDWLRSRGWLTQSDADLARLLPRLGVYDRSLVQAAKSPRPAEPEFADAALVAADLLRLLTFQDMPIERERVTSPDDIARLGALSGGSDGLTVALWSVVRGEIALVEGSHLAPLADLPEPSAFAIGPDRLLFLDTRCTITDGARIPAEGVDAFYIPAR